MNKCIHCGGIHFGSPKCPFLVPCVVCADDTLMACSDCAIDSGGTKSVHVCVKPSCRDQHESSVHGVQP